MSAFLDRAHDTAVHLLSTVPGPPPIVQTVHRVMPWLWCTLPVMALSGLPFVLARPQRYFSNPVFGRKFALVLHFIALRATHRRRLQMATGACSSFRVGRRRRARRALIGHLS